MDRPYLQFQAIGKRFPGVQALSDITLGVNEGSVHALLGENGAGKSTLLKILSGVYVPDEGQILLGEQPRRFHSPIEAIRAGIAVIYQELNLAPEMTVAENILLGQMPNRLGWIDKQRMTEIALRELAILEEDISPNMRLGSLPIAQRQMVEIAKALSRNARVIAFDEPTSSLTERETRKLFLVIRELQRRGRVILYVSHRMQEIFEICDAVTVFRDGRIVESFGEMGQVTTDLLVQRMVGRPIQDVYNYTPRPQGQPLLEVEGLTGRGLAEPTRLSLAAGEIVGLFGLVGAGRTELLKLIFGATRPTGGRIALEGRALSIRKPAEAIQAGIMLCPEDRKKEGIIPIRSVGENINLSVRRTFARLGFINSRKEKENAEAYIRRLGIKTPSLSRLIRSLSGGNQQKVILARWLSERVRVMLLDEPTRGIDIGAKSEIYAIMTELARAGVGVMVVSSDLPEILGISDRILVMRQGRLVASLTREEATEERVLHEALPVAEPSNPLNTPRLAIN